MKYIIRGKPRYGNDAAPQDVDLLGNIEDAKKEAYNLRLEHPAWVFWISEEEDGYVEKIQKSIRSEPELSV